MGLLDLWQSERDQVIVKRIDQLIAFAGEGRLLDGNATSRELRELLAAVPSDLLGDWLDQCLQNRFPDFGFVLQDIINEIGRRLNFTVTPGVYRGRTNHGFDGFWQTAFGHGIVVESKSSVAYSIDITHIGEYRKQLSPVVDIPAEQISILIVVGSEDTTELESQVRGSRLAWDVRLLGVRSLFKLLKLREVLDDPEVERQIQEILVPQEFTRLDRIIDLVFATAEDAQSEQVPITAEIPEESIAAGESIEKGVSPSSFHSLILPKLETRFQTPLVKRSRVIWASPDGQVVVSCQVSKYFNRTALNYWFGLKRSTQEALQEHPQSFCAFGLGSPEKVILLPFRLLSSYLGSMFTSPDASGEVLHWHIRFTERDGQVFLLTNRDRDPVNVTQHLL